MLTPHQLLEKLPQQPPFRFVDEVLEVDGQHIVCNCRLQRSEAFFRGHFPDQPLAPGVILLEMMAQAGVVLQGLYLLAAEGGVIDGYRTLFTDAQVEWHAPVYPDETLTAHGRLLAWRRRRIRSHVELRTGSGSLAASGVLGGMGVRI